MSHIGAGITIKGEVFSKEDLYIDGFVEGRVEAADSRLTIGPHATVRAHVKGREVNVLGKLRGNVEAHHRVAVGARGELVGDVRTGGITIDDGAYFKGNIDILRTPAKSANSESAAHPAVAENAA